MIEEIKDIFGNTRRLGSLELPANFVSSFDAFEKEHQVWDDADIIKAIKHPDHVKRRKLFGAKWLMNQRNHGSCNGFAAAYVYSKCRWLRGLMDGLLFSGAWLYSLMNRGQDNGSILEDGLKRLKSDGVCLQSTVPWDQIYPRLQPSHAKAEAAKHKGLIVFPCETLQGLRTGLAQGFCAVVAVHAGNNFQQLNRHGIAGVNNGRGNHAVHVDDIDLIDSKIVYDMPNSWGAQYGIEGRAYLTDDHFEQTKNSHMFYLCAATQEADL